MPKRELVVNVDDIGIHPGAVDAAIETITAGVAASGSVMCVCPGTAAALELIAAHGEIPVGVHLVLTNDSPHRPWAPLTAGPSIQEDGRLLGIADRERLLAQADPADVEAEFRAQIERFLDAGLRPTHLDWHALADGGREDVFDLTLGLAEEYGTGIRAWTDRGRRLLVAAGRVAQDGPFLDSFGLPVAAKERLLLERIRALPAGLHEWAMHPALASGEDGSDVRTTDRAVLLGGAVRGALEAEGIEVLGWGDPRFRAPRPERPAGPAPS